MFFHHAKRISNSKRFYTTAFGQSRSVDGRKLAQQTCYVVQEQLCVHVELHACYQENKHTYRDVHLRKVQCL